jgi:hypothetical protein
MKKRCVWEVSWSDSTCDWCVDSVYSSRKKAVKYITYSYALSRILQDNPNLVVAETTSRLWVRAIRRSVL